MSPAEITQQLGLQSLTRRAWVSHPPFSLLPLPLGQIAGTSLTPTLTVHPIHLRHHRRRSLRGSGVARWRSPEDEPRLSGYNHETRGVYVGAREKYHWKSANGLMMTMAGVLREADLEVRFRCFVCSLHGSYFSSLLAFICSFFWRHVKIAVSPFSYQL
jgi:hypothetical protein